jgi:hypothetical protein
MAKRRLSRADACDILASTGAGRGDFYALSSSIVDRLVAAADKLGYRRPKNANGSRARYFHAHLERRCGNNFPVSR